MVHCRYTGCRGEGKCSALEGCCACHCTLLPPEGLWARGPSQSTLITLDTSARDQHRAVSAANLSSKSLPPVPEFVLGRAIWAA